MRLHRVGYVRMFLVLMAAGCGIIWAFTNLSYDGEYQMAMAYRLIQGDRMFVEMWEPHQTSVFLPAALMWIYRSIFHTTTGIVVYLQICGILIRGAIALLLYRILKADTDEPVAYGIALLYFMLSPKDYALPDFSNQQLWYGTLFFCCLWSYLKKGKCYLLALGAVCLCLEVLSYPSHLIIYLGAMVLLWCYSEHRWRDIAVITAICAGLGLGFCFVFVPEWDVLVQCIHGMLELEPTHTVSASSKILFYLKGMGELSGMIILMAILGYVVGLIMQAAGKAGSRTDSGKAGGRKRPGYEIWLLGCAIVILAGFLVNILSADHRNAYSCIFVFLVGLGFRGINFLKGDERRLYICGNVIGLLSFAATLILTDLPVRDSVVYGLLAIVLALIPLGKQVGGMAGESVKRGLYGCALCFAALLALRCVYIRTPLSGRGQICSILSDMSIVRAGPATGLISDEEGVCIQRDSYPEWQQLIRKGDKVWMVGGVLDTLGYLYEDVEVAAPSTMSDPTYNDAVLEYWRLNPDKYPDVVIAEGHMGDLVHELVIDQWLTSWLEEEYQPEYVVSGTYWIYYFREKR